MKKLCYIKTPSQSTYIPGEVIYRDELLLKFRMGSSDTYKVFKRRELRFIRHSKVSLFTLNIIYPSTLEYYTYTLLPSKELPMKDIQKRKHTEFAFTIVELLNLKNPFNRKTLYEELL